MRIIGAILIFLVGYSIVFGQVSLEERLLEERTDGSEQSELMEIIMNLKENPINLNTASLQDLEILPDLTAVQRKAIIAHRKKLGHYKSISELLDVPEIDPDTFTIIRELVTTRAPGTAKLTHLQLRTRVLNRLDEPVGFKNGTYENSPSKVYNRLRFALGTNLSGGI
ncbi:MAG: ComEA family DNA-binding protein, partial [bacterium]